VFINKITDKQKLSDQQIQMCGDVYNQSASGIVELDKRWNFLALFSLLLSFSEQRDNRIQDAKGVCLSKWER